MIGKIVDGLTGDASNMGCAMARAAFDSLYTYFSLSDYSPKNFDYIVTGDLGKVGSELIEELISKEKEIISTLRLEKFNVPVFIDYRRKFDELNRLPENQLFRTFLLDENNKIRLIGNPIHGMEKLYLKVLNKH